MRRCSVEWNKNLWLVRKQLMRRLSKEFEPSRKDSSSRSSTIGKRPKKGTPRGSERNVIGSRETLKSKEVD